MLTLKTLRDDPQHVIEKLAVKNFDARAIVEKVLELDTNRRALQTESDAIVAKQFGQELKKVNTRVGRYTNKYAGKGRA